ncbi:MAG: 4Fe-4S binding protein [Actinobacteria bacterium]|nr:4Fe-4S binding protein [Actinomycetota bacterium]
MNPLAVAIDRRCVGCGLCLITCPERALRPARHRPDVDEERCTGCLACVEVCPADAIEQRCSPRGRSGA